MHDLNPMQQELKARAAALAPDVVAPGAGETDRTEAYPWDVVRALRDAGFMGMPVPAAYGGPGLDQLDTCLVIEEIASARSTSGRIVVASNLGALGAVMAYGTEARKRLWAERVRAGDKPAIGIAEPAAGSDAAATTTTARRRGDRWVLDGTKHWITGGGVSALHLILARLEDAGEARGIGGGFPEPALAAKAKIFAAEPAIRVTNDAMPLMGATGYSRRRPLERLVPDARMFAIAGGTAQVLRNLVAHHLLDAPAAPPRRESA
ncbi:MAG: acyl-CoA dehydrogenase family protein [Alphaproteobacteria bacterium]